MITYKNWPENHTPKGGLYLYGHLRVLPPWDIHPRYTICLQSIRSISIADVFMQLLLVFSVAVSAKESDGSVHAAVQSLVRHLLQQRMKRKSGNKKGLFGNTAVEEQAYVSISPLKDEEKEFVPLIHTKISEVSILLKRERG